MKRKILSNMPVMPGRIVNPKQVVILLACMISLLICYNAGRGFIFNSGYFIVEDVEVVLVGGARLPNSTVRSLLNLEKGNNMFAVNLAEMKKYILREYPEIKSVAVARMLPNKLSFKVRPRIPVAQISLGFNYCLVDAEGVILPHMRHLMLDSMPVIKGLDSQEVVRNLGEEYDSGRLREAISLIKAVERSLFYQEHQLHMVDVADEKNISLIIEGGLEVKVGSDEFESKLDLLDKVFREGIDKRHVKYIDLRFGDVVIGTK
ncbi:MAG: cell division protein FtsQ/DivIB [Candidatus Omnitrophota bacterium]